MKKRKDNPNRISFLQQDLGIFAVAVMIFISILIIAFTPEWKTLEYIIMIMITFICMLFAAYRFTIGSVILAGLQVTIYTVYKIFTFYRDNGSVIAMDYLWVVYPLMAVGSVILFISRNQKIESENIRLNQQISELVIIDPLTGLYNIKGFYQDLKILVSLAERKKMDLTLMIVAIRYEEELEKVLGKSVFQMVRKRLAAKIEDLIRIEDRLYSLDEKGTFALILYSDNDGAEIVKKRIRTSIEATDLFSDIIKNKVIMLELQIGKVQYDAEIFKSDLISFKQKVESELQYDV